MPSVFQAVVALQRSATDRELVVFDATLESVHTRTADITAVPVENGADVTDHRRTRPLVYRFTALFLKDAQDRGIAWQRAPHIGKALDAYPADVRVNETRALDLLQSIVAIHDESETFAVFTDMENLPIAMLESLESRLVGAGDAVEIVGVVKEVRFAFSARQPVPAEEHSRSAKKKKKKGTVGGKQIEEPKSKSVLKVLVD